MELNTILNILSEYNLSADELLLIWLTLYAQDEEKHSEYFKRWFEDCDGKSKLRNLFDSLKNKLIIKKNYNPDTFIPNEIEFNKNFLKKYYKQSGKLGAELFDKYEPFIQINGRMFSLKNISKKFYTLEDFYFYYSSQIGHNPIKHKEIIDLLEWGKENNLIKYNILEFVASHKWNELKQMKDQGFTPDVGSSFDLYQSI